MSKAFIEFDLSDGGFIALHFFQCVKANSKSIIDIFDCLFFAIVLFWVHIFNKAVESLSNSKEVGMEQEFRMFFKVDIKLVVGDGFWRKLTFNNSFK